MYFKLDIVDLDMTLDFNSQCTNNIIFVSQIEKKILLKDIFIHRKSYQCLGNTGLSFTCILYQAYQCTHR